MVKARTLSIIIPCYNEKDTVRKLIKKVKDVDIGNTKKEIIIIDDCSTDGTIQILKETLGADPDIRIIYQKVNNGKGAALKRGILKSTGDVLIVQDADLEYNPGEYTRLLEPIERNQADVVYGSRFLGGDPHLTVYNANKYANKYLTMFSNLLSGQRITDMETCYKMMRGDLARSLAKNLVSQRFGFEPEISARIAKSKAYVYEVGISYQGRTKEEGKKIGLKDGIKAVWEIIYFNKIAKANGYIYRKDSEKRSIKKIVLVSDTIYPYFKGGKEKRLSGITKRLASMGYDVHIYTMKWWDGPNNILEEGIYLHGISKLYPVYKSKVRSLKASLLFSVACIKLMWVKFDIIDVDHIPYFPLFTVWIICKIRRKKMFATWHEVWSREYWQEYLGVFGIVAYFVERLSSFLPDRIIVSSEHTREKLLRRHPKKQKRLVTAYSAIDLAEIGAIEAAKETNDVLFAGRLLKHKNVTVLIHAIAELKPDFNSISCTIVGDGPDKKNLEKLVHSLGLEDNIRFTGFLPEHSDLYALMKSSKVFVLPSKREGFGIVVIEANACGLPVLTLDHPDNGARELIIDNVNGHLFSTHLELAARIKDYVENDKEAPEKYIKSVKKYDWQTTINEILSAYSE